MTDPRQAALEVAQKFWVIVADNACGDDITYQQLLADRIFAYGQQVENNALRCHKCDGLVETGDVFCSKHEAEIIAKLVQQARLEEAKWWKERCSHHEDWICSGETEHNRIAELEAACGKEMK